MKEKLQDLIYEIKYKFSERKSNNKKVTNDNYNYGSQMDFIKLGYFTMGITILVIGTFFILGSISYNKNLKNLSTEKEEILGDYSKRDTSYLKSYKDLSSAQIEILKSLEGKSAYISTSIEDKTVNIYKDNSTKNLVLGNFASIISPSYTEIEKGSIVVANLGFINLSPNNFKIDLKKTYLIDKKGNRIYPDKKYYISSEVSETNYILPIQDVKDIEIYFKIPNNEFQLKSTEIQLNLTDLEDSSNQIKLKYKKN